MMKKLTSHPAILTLTAMVVIGFVATSIAVFLVLSSVDILQQGLYDTEYQETFAGADGCVEEVLIRLNSDSSYSGDSFTIGSISCTATVTGAVSLKSVRVEATQGSTYVSTLEVTVNASTTPITITNWEEVL